MEAKNFFQETLISEFPGVRSKAASTITLQQFVDVLHSDRYRRVVERYRTLRQQSGHEAEAQQLKEDMP